MLIVRSWDMNRCIFYYFVTCVLLQVTLPKIYSSSLGLVSTVIVNVFNSSFNLYLWWKKAFQGHCQILMYGIHFIYFFFFVTILFSIRRNCFLSSFIREKMIANFLTNSETKAWILICFFFPKRKGNLPYRPGVLKIFHPRRTLPNQRFFRGSPKQFHKVPIRKNSEKPLLYGASNEGWRHNRVLS